MNFKNDAGIVSVRILGLVTAVIVCMPVINYVNKEVVPQGYKVANLIKQVDKY